MNEICSFNILGNNVSGKRRDDSSRRAPPLASDRKHAGSLYSATGVRKYLNADERGRALVAIANLPPQRALFALTLAWTGARVSEVLSLRAASFQIERGIVSFTTLKRRRHNVREVPIPPALMSALDAHFLLSSTQHDTLTLNRHPWPWCRQTGWRVIKSIMKEAGISGRAASPRGLRHAFGVGTLQAGIPITLVQRWLGHARLATTAIYTAASGPEETAFAARYWRSGEERLPRAAPVQGRAW